MFVWEIAHIKIKLILYRDCTSATPFRHSRIHVSFLHLKANLYSTLQFQPPVISDVPAESENPCLDAPDDICVEQAIYTKTIFLPPSETGYIVVLSAVL
jgi:hypothetical protein